MVKKLAVSAVVVAGVVVGSAAPSYAFFCNNANKNPDAGVMQLKESKAQANFDTSRAWNSGATGAWVDAGIFEPEFSGVIMLGRNGLHPAAIVGSPDHGIVEADF